MNKKFKFFASWILVFMWAGLIFWSSSVDFTGGNSGQGGSDTLPITAHLVEYLVLTTLLTVALRSSGVSKKRAIVMAFLLSIIYGITDEWHQYFTPNREPHFSDWLLDVAASFIVFSVFSWRWKIKQVNR
jgi:VanZ family protein